MLLIALLIIVLSIPSVQLRIAKRVTNDLNNTYGTCIEISRLGLNWKGEVDIREIYIPDHHEDTLVYTKSLQTNILSLKKLFDGDLDFGQIDLKETKLYVTTYANEENDNLSIFAEKFDTGEKSEKPFLLTGNEISLSNGHIKITDYNLETPQIFDLTDVNLAAENFSITGPNIEANIKKLSLASERGFKINSLEAQFSYSLEEMIFKKLHLSSEGSEIKGDIKLIYGEKGLGDFENNVNIVAALKDTKLSTSDLNGFYNEFGEGQIISLNGTLEGTLNDFTFTKASLSVGNSDITGDFVIKNILNEEESYYIKGQNHRISSNYYELNRFMPRILGDVLPNELKSIGQFTFSGNSELTESKFITDANIVTSIGDATISATLSNLENIEQAVYKGNIKLSRFNLGKIVGTTSVGNVTANIDFDGMGFTQKTVNTKISGTISTFTFERYKYQKLLVKGNLKYPLFNGELSIDDPNLKLSFKGLIDVSKEFNQYDFEADIEFAELNKLNLVTRDSISVFAGKVIMDMDGTTIDNAEGTITFKETFYQSERDDFYFDDFIITSSFEGTVRTIEVNSPDIANGKISGEFLIEDITNLFQNGIGSTHANYIPQEVTTNQYIDYEFIVYNKIVEVFVPQLQLGENSRVRGSVYSDESKFKLFFKSPEILLFNNYLGKVNIQMDNDNPIFNTYISIDSVYTGKYNVTDVNVINKTINDTLFVRSEFKGGSKMEDLFNLSLYHTIDPSGKSVIGVKKSDITYKDNVWVINKYNNNLNKVVFDDNFNTVRIDSLVFRHDNEIIQLAGSIRDSTYKDLKLEFKDVNIGNIVPEVDSLRLQGNTNGRLHFVQKNKVYYPTSTMTIDNVIINDIPFGDLDLKIIGNKDLTKYSINTSLTINDVKSINAVGEIDVSTEQSRLKMEVELNNFNLQAFSPFGADIVTNIRGGATGNIRVTGNYRSPDIFGRVFLEDSGMKLPYLNVDFNLDNSTQIVIKKNSFEIGKTTITDTKFNSIGTFSGIARHTNFEDWELHLKVGAEERLLVLDTPPNEDALYYGTAFISGSADIKGPIDELVIDVVATTEEGTTFKIPLSDVESIGDDSFIKFLSPAEKAARINGETIISKDIKGLSLNFELDINEKAEVEIVVDPINNSRLIGRGAGILLIEINTLGKFKMWGDFMVIKGEYDFRYGGIIQKYIEVVPGGNITWDGSPERARLDLSAMYRTKANPSILLDNPSVNQKIPVNVLVDLTGELIQPDINFRIEFPRVSSIVRSQLEYKLQTKEQRENQAMFLIASGSFVNENYQGTDAFKGTLVERVSGMVNEIFSDQDGKFNVGLDYSQGSGLPNQETSDRFGITLSTQINERILINGVVGVPVGGVNETAIAGDIEVQWLANDDGSLRMSFFNRQAEIQFIGEDQTFEQGAGVSYSVDFDTFRELVNKLFNRKLTLESEMNEPFIPDDNSLPAEFNNDGTRENNED